MSYLALYRKYRPSSFDQVQGQDHIVTTLKNQINANRIGHAYLFCGTRGTGKTSVAKLFAKAVNCSSPVNGSPCGTCDVCRAIDTQSSMNVIEIDAASNNSVNNIRDIIEEVKYSPAEGRYKVYIVDEVHMLSVGAFNALLKTLEEPPSYVIFILATTEVNKLPITILSRCQRYDFKRISVDTITQWLSQLMDKEGVKAEEKALRYVAKAADGSMRDAQSLLDQCLALYMGQELTYDKVLDVLGSVDIEVFAELLRYINDQRVNKCIELLDEIALQGREMTQFVGDFAGYLRNLLIIRTVKYPESILEFSSENIELMKQEAAIFEEEIIIRYITVLSELSNKLRYAVQKRLLVEVELIRLCKPEMDRGSDKNVNSLINRIANIEKQLESGVIARSSAQDPEHSPEDPGGPDETLAAANNVPISDRLKEVVENWNYVIEKIKDPWIKVTAKTSVLSTDDGEKISLITNNMITGGGENPNTDAIKAAIMDVFGYSLDVEVVKKGDRDDTQTDDLLERLKVIKRQ
ncbi:MAG: DNA polymerase III subunit gamma/tau [Lachnospiraceae bacterium]|nr:DNA polymerase III subunit gamma/tau [Lachnospiraceae bacterium]